MSRQRTAVALRRRGAQCWLSRFDLGRLLGERLLQILDPLVQRIVAELLRAAAKAVTQQTGDQHLQPRDLGLGFEQQDLQRRRILWQRGGGDGHRRTVNPQPVPHQLNPA